MTREELIAALSSPFFHGFFVGYMLRAVIAAASRTLKARGGA